ncbi:MAG: thiamine pyrophosphate-binding protein [Synergistaceae bacterium]|nr:thiamine pyrophosphate-binding protein [Synergistaceae bacterium]
MNVCRAILAMLDDYDVTDVFGLPGETTLALYREWLACGGPAYHLCRDERSAVFMADGYAKATGKVGVCEGPSVGATHMVPGVIEAFKGCTPLVVLTSDVPLAAEKKNMLTGFDQKALFEGICKESLTAHEAGEVPHLLRRAFRVASTGRPGPVHLRLPSDVLEGELDDAQVWSQPRFGSVPSCPFRPDDASLAEAASLLEGARYPLMICGQGALASRAWKEVALLAEALAMPVGTTINGKGILAETHPLSIGVIGARGGREWANRFVAEADVILFVGSSTDSAGTAGWTLPSPRSGQRFIQIDAAAEELGGNYDALPLFGDAALTLAALLEALDGAVPPERGDWVASIAQGWRNQEARIGAWETRSGCALSSLAVVRALAELPEETFFAVDPGLSAVYSAAFLRLAKAGRFLAYNFAMGALGYAIPAALGARFGVPSSRPVVALVGDGSFGFAAGELETAARLGTQVLFIVFDNKAFGWIRGTEFVQTGKDLEPAFDGFTSFRSIDYVKIAEGFGLQAWRAEKASDLKELLRQALAVPGPTLLAVPVEVQDHLLPPVPGWADCARKRGMETLY